MGQAVSCSFQGIWTGPRAQSGQDNSNHENSLTTSTWQLGLTCCFEKRDDNKPEAMLWHAVSNRLGRSEYSLVHYYPSLLSEKNRKLRKHRFLRISVVCQIPTNKPDLGVWVDKIVIWMILGFPSQKCELCSAGPESWILALTTLRLTVCLAEQPPDQASCRSSLPDDPKCWG